MCSDEYVFDLVSSGFSKHRNPVGGLEMLRTFCE